MKSQENETQFVQPKLFEMQVSGFGQISPLGGGRALFRQAILDRRMTVPRDQHAGSPQEAANESRLPHPKLTHTEIQTSRGTVSVAHVSCPAVELPDALPDSVKRRMPRLSGMFFSSVFEAVEDAFGADQKFLRENPERVGLVVGTAFGALSTAIAYERRLIQDGPIGASPTLFAGSIQNAVAAQLSIALGIRGPTSTVTTMELTTLNVLQMAADWLEQDVVDHVVIAIGDEISEIHLYAMANIESVKLSKPGFKLGLSQARGLGEGVVSLVLSRTNEARSAASQVGLTKYPKVTSLLPQRPGLPIAARILCSPWRDDEQLDLCLRMARGVAHAESEQARATSAKSLDENAATPKAVEGVQTHIALYGSTPLGLAFELASAICLVGEDHVASACVQINESHLVDGVMVAL